MSKKNGVAPPREGTATAVREAARSGVPESPTTPARPKRRTFAAEYKLRIVREADAALASGAEGAIAELLRREGLYSSYLTVWRCERDAGELAGRPVRKGPDEIRNPYDHGARQEQHRAFKQAVLDAGHREGVK